MTAMKHSANSATKPTQSNYTPPPLDEEERNRILMEQMPQVRYIARHIHDRLPQHVPMEDLVHAGVLGLMDALTKYDEARQVQFKTYAKFRIRGAILDSLRELDWSPRDLRRKARMIEVATAKLGNLLHRSDANNSSAYRWGYIASYNAVENAPFKRVREYGNYEPLHKVAAGSFLKSPTRAA